MKNFLLLLASLGFLGACAKQEASAPLAPGNYDGRLYVTVSGAAQGSSSRRVTDTTLRITTAANGTFSVLDRQLTASPTSHQWLGHAPLRANYALDAGFGYSNGILLQKEQAGDSIYIDYRKGGRVANTYYQFYAKKQ